ncbi:MULTISPECIES: iron-sulfur cluster assembly scaffold protein [unclassified Legionella]|uniref:iron-sulfur cluster assembly scaffold protein n=1 Tax=unclassified Legionella TaxID=2622702 RepID=UPI0010551B66|nr:MULTISPECIES: iron-sulfur cluster assembly scaffold protein [unclassified Legionella]MDI9817671.1 iron-sulfur cluster assembly scaffold protein [Legionella sp. PL877]
MMYNELVESCFFAPKHVGTIDNSNPLTVHCRTGTIGREDVCDFYLLCDVDGLVRKARFKAYGDPYLIAAAELVCRQLEGSQIKDHPRLDYGWLVQQLEIPNPRYPVALKIEDGYQAIVTKMQAKLQEEKKCLK